jgi:hypothetical protein
MIIVHATKSFMAIRPENLPPGWWIVDRRNDKFFDGPYRSKKAAMERYGRLPASLKDSTPFG